MASSILQGLARRGVISRLSSATVESAAGAMLAAGRTPSAYAGFDPTGPSLHLGHLSVLMMMTRLQLAGWRPILLVGGATAQIGDPTGRTVERPLLSEAQIAANVRGVEACLCQLLDTDAASPTGARLVNNASFYAHTDMLRFLREVGTHVRVNAMLARDSVRARLAPAAPREQADVAQRGPSVGDGEGLSYAEFSYQVFQAADFLHLHRRADTILQVGGADQWGNITAGIDLVRRVCAAAQSQPAQPGSPTGGAVFGLTVPLLTTGEGRKVGKSEGNAIYLTAPGRDPATGERVPGSTPHALYQHLLGTADAAAPPLLASLTLLPEGELDSLVAESGRHPEGKATQRALAEDVVRRLHGQGGLDVALRAAGAIFGRGDGSPLSGAELSALADAGDVPCARIDATQFLGRPLAEVLQLSGAAASKAEAKRLLAGGGVYLNGARVEAGRCARSEDLLEGGIALLKLGKRTALVLRV